MQCYKKPLTAQRAHELIRNAKAVKKQRDKQTREIFAYKCEICGYYHTTGRRTITNKLKNYARMHMYGKYLISDDMRKLRKAKVSWQREDYTTD